MTLGSVELIFVCNLFIRRMQSSGFYSSLLGPVSDQVLRNRASKDRELHQVILYSPVAVG